METFPEEYELLGFFEVEPKLPRSGGEFAHNKVVYTNKFGNDEVEFSIEPMYGEIKLQIIRDSVLVGKYILNQVHSVSIVGKDMDAMVVAFEKTAKQKLFKLRLKPFPQIEWGNEKDNYD
jgi:hypothetical protein